MKDRLVSGGILFFLVSSLFFIFPMSSRAQEKLREGMTQGEFALWLVKAIGAQSKLPPAALAEDAINFLTQLGVIPEGGWQKDEAVTNEMLADLLDDPEAVGLDFEELVGRVRDRVQSIFDERVLGVFRVQSSGTPSAPA